MANTRAIKNHITEKFDELALQIGTAGEEGGDISGDIWFVDSNNGSADYTGTRTSRAFASITSAIAAASAGDTIVLLEAHAETTTAVVNITLLAGLKILGQGVGTRRPAFTHNSATDLFNIASAGVVIENILFNEATAVTGGMVNVGAADAVIRGCEFDLGANDAEAITIAAAGSRCTIEHCDFYVTANGPDAAIEIEAASDNLIVRNCLFDGGSDTNAWDAAAINSTAACLLVTIKDCDFRYCLTAQEFITLDAVTVQPIIEGCNFKSGAALASQLNGPSTFYVDSGKGNDAAGCGGSWHAPTATIDYAIGLCSANAGDTIFVAPGHAETRTTAITVDIAGVSIIGLGRGTLRPYISCATTGIDVLDVTAANCSIKNIGFNEQTVANNTSDINIAGANCLIEGCHFDLGANNLECITIADAGDFATIRNNWFVVTANGPDAAIEVESANTDGTLIEGNTFVCSDGTNTFDAAAINSTVANTNMVIKSNTFLGAGIASTSLIAATAVKKTVVGNSYGDGAVAVASDNINQGTYIQGTNPFGVTWYVAASGGNDSFSGKSPTEAFATIAAAITAGSAGDVFILGPGTHSVDVSTAALVPLADMHFKGAIPTNGGKPSTIITHDADDGADLCTVDVDGVVFEDVEFLLVAGGTTALRTMAVSQTTAVTGLTFKNCWFNLNSVDAASVIALAVNDATNATTGLVVTGCRFTGGDGTTGQISYIQIGIGGLLKSVIERNVFELESADADCYGVDFLDNAAAANKGYATVIRDNDFFGPLDAGCDGIGIFIAAALTELEILAMARTNYFAFCNAPPITIDKMNKGFVWNYVGDDATGGTLVDPGT